jgi:hypothetical protein
LWGKRRIRPRAKTACIAQKGGDPSTKIRRLLGKNAKTRMKLVGYVTLVPLTAKVIDCLEKWYATNYIYWRLFTIFT